MSTGTQNYRKAYESAAEELNGLLEQQEHIEGRVLSLRKTMNVLSALISEGEESKDWRDHAAARLEKMLQTSLTDDIYKILRATWPHAMTTSDVRDELNKLGGSLAEQSNPLATINAILNRLVESHRAEEATKGGRKAWRSSPTLGQQVAKVAIEASKQFEKL